MRLGFVTCAVELFVAFLVGFFVGVAFLALLVVTRLGALGVGVGVALCVGVGAALGVAVGAVVCTIAAGSVDSGSPQAVSASNGDKAKAASIRLVIMVPPGFKDPNLMAHGDRSLNDVPYHNTPRSRWNVEACLRIPIFSALVVGKGEVASGDTSE